MEALRAAGKDVMAFTLNANGALENAVKAARVENIFVERKIDRRLLELKALGFLNGHTPFSSILAVLGVGLAAMFDFKYVAISQERSSNEGNIKYLGKDVNHQYSKTLDFENKFREYSRKYLAKNIEYFSFLRPLYEIQIAEIFSRYPKYFDSFLSCNKSFTIAARESGDGSGWCGQCSKCLSVFAMLYPFIGRDETVKIFSKNLFESRELLTVARELLGEGECKPMECVGTFGEMRAAFYLSVKKTVGELPYLLKYFQQSILPKYPKIELQSKKIISSWTDKNNLPKNLAAALKRAVVDNFV
jgi:hypothetical protein